MPDNEWDLEFTWEVGKTSSEGLLFYITPNGQLVISGWNSDSDSFYVTLDQFQIGQLKDLLQRTE